MQISNLPTGSFSHHHHTGCRMKHNLIFTSAVISTFSGCVVPTPTANVVFLKLASENVTLDGTIYIYISEGSQVQYACKESMVRISGDVVRTCQNDTLTGADLVCELGELLLIYFYNECVYLFWIFMPDFINVLIKEVT